LPTQSCARDTCRSASCHNKCPLLRHS
jgi:hypothetical protein